MAFLSFCGIGATLARDTDERVVEKESRSGPLPVSARLWPARIVGWKERQREARREEKKDACQREARL